MAENLQLATKPQMIKQTTESKRQAKHSSILVTVADLGGEPLEHRLPPPYNLNKVERKVRSCAPLTLSLN